MYDFVDYDYHLFNAEKLNSAMLLGELFYLLKRHEKYMAKGSYVKKITV